MLFGVPNTCWNLSPHKPSGETENPTKKKAKQNKCWATVPGTSQLWKLPTNRIVSMTFLNLSRRGSLVLNSAALLKLRFPSRRMQVLWRGYCSQSQVLPSEHMHVQHRVKRRCHCQYQKSPSTMWNEGETHEETQATVSATGSWWEPALLLMLLFSLWSIPLPLPWQVISTPLSFIPLCQHKSLYSWTMTQSGKLIQLKINFFPFFFFFSWLCYFYRLSNLVQCAATRNFVPAKGKAQQKKTSTSTLEVLDFINWKWSYGAVKVKTIPSYKTNLLYGVRLVLQVSFPNFSLFRLYVLQSKIFCLLCTHVINS